MRWNNICLYFPLLTVGVLIRLFMVDETQKPIMDDETEKSNIILFWNGKFCSYIQILISRWSYRAVNTVRLGYKNRSVNAV